MATDRVHDRAMGRWHNEITPSELHDYFVLDAENGRVFWKPRGLPKWDAKWAGKEAASKANTGYLTLRVRYKAYLVHRVVWAMVKGEWPSGQIDHINGIRSDNRIANLRVATNAENQQNRTISARNKSGYLGVCWFKPKEKWKAEIRLNNKVTHIGYFDTAEEASEAYKAAKARLHTFCPVARAV